MLRGPVWVPRTGAPLTQSLRYMSSFRPLALGALLAFGLAGCDSASPDSAAPSNPAFATADGVVTASDVTAALINAPVTDDWMLYTRDAGSGVFEPGPAPTPLGIGSLRLETTASNDKVTLFNYDHSGKRLNLIDGIGYATYRTAGSLQQVAALNIQVDANGPAVAEGFTTLVFEPVYNTSQGPVTSGVWQQWNAFSGGTGIWWSSNPIPGAPNRDTFVSWNAIIAANPNAVIVGGFGVNQGSGNAGLTTAVDKLTIGNAANAVVYDFEQFKVPTDRRQCFDGGWMGLSDAEGNSFRNQGQCAAYVNRS